MLIETLRVTNYKRFRDSGIVSLRPGMNILVGQNDAGKTALVEAMSLQFGSTAHRSILTLPTPTTRMDGISSVEMRLSLSSDELKQVLGPHLVLTVRAKSGEESRSFIAMQEAANKGAYLEVTWRLGNAELASLSGLPDDGNYRIQFANNASPHGLAFAYTGTVTGGTYPPDVSSLLAAYVRTQIYTFKAERLRVGRGMMGVSTELSPDASNLPEVLNYLHSSNPSRYRRLVAHVREVFPHIEQVTTRPVAQNEAVIELWDMPDTSERADLAIPLSESGTGIGQVLAMLYVVVTATDPRVIVIDEPHSFLHPGAVRKLFAILRSYPHQYIITTHSPTAITSAIPNFLGLVKRDGHESKVTEIDPASGADLTTFLSEVGARLSDVLGPDRIAWVEGKTEEVTFPMILRKFSPAALVGLEILAVQQTGDLEGKHAERVVQIYQRLAQATTILPPAAAFLLDPENRPAHAQDRLSRLGGGLVRFLPRRMYENYLIISDAITSALNVEDTDKKEDYSVDMIERWLGDNGLKHVFFSPGAPPTDTNDRRWIETVHGANLLASLFAEISDHRVTYDKVRHGSMLTEYLLSAGAGDLHELSQWLIESLTH